MDAWEAKLEEHKSFEKKKLSGISANEVGLLLEVMGVFKCGEGRKNSIKEKDDESNNLFCYFPPVMRAKDVTGKALNDLADPAGLAALGINIPPTAEQDLFGKIQTFKHEGVPAPFLEDKPELLKHLLDKQGFISTHIYTLISSHHPYS